MIQKRLSISVMAVAMLSVFAVAAVMLLSGGNPAQATTAETITPANGGSIDLRPVQQDPQPTPRFPAEPPCPGETGNTNTLDTVVDSGQIALFDVWWNPHEGELTNTSCPPTVEYVPGGRAGTKENRSASSIDIAETVIHIPNGAKVELTETAYPKDKFQDLWDADEAESASGGDGYVWELPVCPDSPATTPLCLSFSAGLLSNTDWIGDIVYHVAHVHQIDIDKQDPRYVLVYEGPTKRDVLRWNSQDLQHSNMPVPAGKYDRPRWFFTSPGTYEFQVNITGTPNHATNRPDGLAPVSLDGTVSSDIRTYILHVGAESDLSVTMPTATPAPRDPAPGDLVTITLRASKAGPDAAPNPKVDVALPDGLEYVSHEPTTATFTAIPDDDTSDDESSEFEPTHTWSLNPNHSDPDRTMPLAKDATKTLTIKARVAQGTRGQEFEVKAMISATQRVTTTSGNFYVPVPDKVSGNNKAERTITVPSIPNVNPVFGIERSVAENTSAGANVGPRIVVKDPDAGDPQIPTLLGDGASSFTVSLVDGGAQIAVASGASLDYECRENYSLTLQVIDNKDVNGNSDTVIDDTIMLDVLITNDVADDPTLTLTLDRIDDQRTAHMSVTHTPSHLGRPDCHDRYSFWEYQFMELVNGDWVVESDDELDPQFDYTAASGGSHTFRVDLVGTRGTPPSFAGFHPIASR